MKYEGFAGLALLLALTSCVSFSRPDSTVKAPAATSGVVYGRFAALEQFGDTGVAIELVTQGRKGTRVIRLAVRPSDQVAAYSVPPGTYRIENAVFTYAMGEVRGRVPFRSSIPGQADEFTVGPGEAVYLGDFGGRVTSFGNMINWSLNELSNNYEASTADFHKRYALLADWPTRTFLGKVAAKTTPLAVTLAYVAAVVSPTGNDQKKTVILENDAYRLEMMPGLQYALLDKKAGTTLRGRTTFTIDLKGDAGSRVYLTDVDPDKVTVDAFLKDESYTKSARFVLTPIAASNKEVTYRVLAPENTPDWTFTYKLAP